MSILVDTSVWSLALRRKNVPDIAEIQRLREALTSPDKVVTTGVIIQELLQGFSGAKSRDLIIDRFQSLSLIQPTITDHIEAAEIRNTCRRGGVQIGTIDALIAQLCIKHNFMLLSTDKDFQYAAKHIDLRIYQDE